jgi:hypothetical protein
MRDPLAAKRDELKARMKAARKWHDEYEVTLASLHEDHLDHLLAFYAGGRKRFVW